MPPSSANSLSWLSNLRHTPTGTLTVYKSLSDDQLRPQTLLMLSPRLLLLNGFLSFLEEALGWRKQKQSCCCSSGSFCVLMCEEHVAPGPLRFLLNSYRVISCVLNNACWDPGGRDGSLLTSDKSAFYWILFKRAAVELWMHTVCLQVCGRTSVFPVHSLTFNTDIYMIH